MTISFCGVAFWNEEVESLVKNLLSTKGDVLVPAAPAFANILDDKSYHAALQDGKYVIMDSGFVALICFLKYKRSISRISGLRLLEYLLLGHGKEQLKKSRVLWVVPEIPEGERIKVLLQRQGFNLDLQHFYLAPFYRTPSDFADQRLAEQIRLDSVDIVIVCIGGGKQEKLAHQLKQMVPSCPPLVCIGAAISFLTGSQAKIPKWVDRTYLGWLWRTFHDPKTFGKRYLETFWKLPRMLWRYYKIQGSLD